MTCLLRCKRPEARMAWSQYGLHAGVTRCDYSPTLGFFICLGMLTRSSTVRVSCKALLGCGDSLQFANGTSLLPAGSDSPEANRYLAGKQCCCVFRCNRYLMTPCKTRLVRPKCRLAHVWGLLLSVKGLQVRGSWLWAGAVMRNSVLSIIQRNKMMPCL